MARCVFRFGYEMPSQAHVLDLGPRLAEPCWEVVEVRDGASLEKGGSWGLLWKGAPCPCPLPSQPHCALSTWCHSSSQAMWWDQVTLS